jgi:CRP/FNR family cyclic AMP-dependent transcriptional regulator
MGAAPSRSVLQMTRLTGRSASATAAQVLAQSPITREAAAPTREALVKAARVVRVQDDVVVTREGEPVEELIIVADGSLEGSRVGRDGRRHVIGIVGHGQPLHLLPAVDRAPATHDIRTRGAATLVYLPRAVFLEAFDADPALARAVLRLLCERIRTLSAIIAEEALLPLSVRAARTLERLIGYFGLVEPDTPADALRLRISQEEFADLLGVTRQSANRELRQLERRGIVRLGRERVDVLDREALIAIAIATRD